MDNTSSLQGPPSFTPPNMPGAANNAYSGIGGLSNTYAGLGWGVMPQAYNTSQNLYNNPYAQAGITGAQNAATLGVPAAYSGFNEGQGLIGAGNSLVPYAGSIMNTGFDPQGALYNRTLQQVQDQANVNNAMAGVGTSPYGAGLTNQATTNFNIDWQNQQLQRQAQAAQAAGGLINTGAGVAGQGVGMMNAAPGQLVQSAMLPYATYSDIGQGQNSALSSLLSLGGQGAGLAQTPIQDYLSYLGVGNQSNSVANQNFSNQLNQANQAWNQQMQFGQGLGSLFGGLGGFPGLSNLFGGMGNLFGSNATSGGMGLGGSGTGSLY